MNDDLTRLLDAPAAARLSVAGDEIALLTLRHEHADKIIIERQRLGTSIDLGELLQIVGLHGLVEGPQLQVTEITAPQLPAPVEETPAVNHACPHCPQTFKNERALNIHMAMKHKEQTQPAVAIAPIARRTTRNAAPDEMPCPDCDRTFKNAHARVVHQGRAHKEVTVPDAPEPAPLPTPVLVAQSTTTSAIPVPVRAASEYTCSACGQSLQLHERCSDCQALLGPEHEAGVAYGTSDGKPLCSVCVTYRATAEQLGVAA